MDVARVDKPAGRAVRRASSAAREQERKWRSGRFAHTYAALDLGTNNCRLLFARATRRGFRVIDAFSRIVRLGEGIGASGRISDAAMERTIQALAVCARKIRRHDVTRARLVATQACRQAENCPEFLERVSAETGLTLEIISSDEEARLAISGCLPLISRRAGMALVFDIGGGSTELIQLDRRGRPSRLSTLSLPLGVVTLAERHGGDRISADVYERMIAEVAGELRAFEAYDELVAAIDRREVQMIGTSGTVTTLAGIHLGLERYDRNRVDGVWLRFDEALGVAASLRDMGYDQRAAHPCIGPDRADLVIAGCAILEAICRAWPVGDLRVADRGIREGLLQGLMRGADREARQARTADR